MIRIQPSSRVLAVNVSSLGDLVSSLALIEALKTLAGDAKIDFVCCEAFRGLLADEPGLNLIDWETAALVPYDVLIDLTSSGETRRKIKKLKARFKLGRADGLIKRVKARFAYDRIVPKDPCHNLVRNFLPMSNALELRAPPFPRLTRPDEKILGGLNLPQSAVKFLTSPERKIAVHPFSKDVLRTLPLSLFMLTLERLRARGPCEIFLVGSPTEVRELHARIETSSDEARAYINDLHSADLDLRQLKAVLAGADRFIGADSGPLHVAAALGTPSLGFFGPTLPSLSLPLAPGTLYVEKLFDCRPCNTQKPCKYDQRCLKQVTAKEIEDGVERLWASS